MKKYKNYYVTGKSASIIFLVKPKYVNLRHCTSPLFWYSYKDLPVVLKPKTGARDPDTGHINLGSSRP